MKSNGKCVFSLIYYPRLCLPAEAQNLLQYVRRLGSRDYFDVIYSAYRLVYNMDEGGFDMPAKRLPYFLYNLAI